MVNNNGQCGRCQTNQRQHQIVRTSLSDMYVAFISFFYPLFELVKYIDLPLLSVVYTSISREGHKT